MLIKHHLTIFIYASVTFYATVREKEFKMSKTLREYILICGGQSKVANHLGVHRKTVWVWEKKGFPRTEWTGETKWADKIARLCRANKHNVTGDKILLDSM